MNEYIETINGLIFHFKTEKVLYFQSETLMQALKEVPVSKLCDNYKIEIGFSLYILKKRAHEEAYDILVPDYKNSPFSETTDDLSLAFLIQLEQISLLQKYSLFGSTVRFDDEILIAKDSLEKPTICLQRFHELSGSGWCINEIHKDQDGNFSNADTKEYEMIYAYQLLSLRPSILSVLFLPYDFIVVFNGEECVEILDENNNSLIETDIRSGLDE